MPEAGCHSTAGIDTLLKLHLLSSSDPHSFPPLCLPVSHSLIVYPPPRRHRFRSSKRSGTNHSFLQTTSPIRYISTIICHTVVCHWIPIAVLSPSSGLSAPKLEWPKSAMAAYLSLSLLLFISFKSIILAICRLANHWWPIYHRRQTLFTLWRPLRFTALELLKPFLYTLPPTIQGRDLQTADILQHWNVPNIFKWNWLTYHTSRWTHQRGKWSSLISA